jgi:hypothetical protein
MVLLSCSQHFVCKMRSEKLAPGFRLDCFLQQGEAWRCSSFAVPSKFLSFVQTEFHIFERYRFAFSIRPECQFTGEMRLTADLINSSLSYLNPNKERELDLRGAFLERADTTL